MPNFHSFRFQNHFFSSPNRVAPPPGLAPSNALPNDPTPSQLKTRLWSSNRYPYLGFMLCTPFHGELLSALATPASKVPIIENRGFFHPPKDLAKQWKMLERTLESCCTALASLYATSKQLATLPLTVPRLPSCYGYYTLHTSKSQVREKLQQSFDAFEIYMAYASFLICLCEYPRKGGRQLPWKDCLGQLKVHPEFLRLLLESPIVDFERERRGTILDLGFVSWAPLAEVFPLASVPLWLHWGESPRKIMECPTWLEPFRPDAYAPVFSLPSTSSHPSQSSVAPLHYEDLAARFPTVQPGSGQKLGQTMKEFFIRRWRNNEDRERHETPAQRQARKQREAAAKGFAAPGKKGAQVFRWALVDGQRIRELYTKNQVEQEWGSFHRREMIFDGFHNCWDICSDYGDEIFEQYFSKIKNIDVESDSDGEYEDMLRQAELDAIEQRASGQGPFTVPSSSKHVEQDSPSRPDGNISPRDFEPPKEDLPPSTPSLMPTTNDSTSEPTDPATLEGGSSPSQSMSAPPSSVVQAPVDGSGVTTFADPLSTTTPVDAEEIEVDAKDADEDLDAADISKVSSSFVVHLQAFHPITFASPQLETLEDLLYNHYGYLASSSPYSGSATISQHLNSWGQISRTVGGRFIDGSPVARQRIAAFLSLIIEFGEEYKAVGDLWDLDSTNRLDLRGASSFAIEKCPFEPSFSFLLKPVVPSTTNPCIPAVSATTALEAVRRDLGPSVENIASFLINRGIPFRLYRPLSSVPRRHVPNPSSIPILGSRSYSYTFDLADYAAYANRRDNFLKGDPRARVALRMGGVIARLARQVLELDLGASGPSLAAIQGEGMQVRHGQTTLVDDDLTPAELDLIVGTYTLEPDMSDEKQQGFVKGLVSWFPRYEAWNTSGLDLGHWTQESEIWFQDRIRAIQDDKDQPFLQRTWRSKLRKNRVAPKLVLKYNQAATAFLDANLNHT